MSGVYSVEDLLKLRASPLVSRPSNLPPIEEWMGSQDTAAKRPNTRGKQEEGAPPNESFQKRPGLDPSLRKSTTDPERLVLGPPRRSFASSSGRPTGKSGATESEDPLKDRSGNHERNRTGEDLETRFGDRRSGNLGGLNSRFGARHDQEGTHPRRRHDEEEVTESKPRKDHERPKWGAREGREDRPLEDAIDESGNPRSALRRDQGRARLEQSWIRGDKTGEDFRRDGDRNSAYRRDRNRDGDWDMPTKNDVDPEWMGSIEAAEPPQARTQEDFQRWKERMKAGTGANETRSEPVAINNNEAFFVNDVDAATAAPIASIISPDTSNSMDKFFARFSEKSSEDKATTKAPAKTRFASIFGPASDNKATPTPPPTDHTAVSIPPQESAKLEPTPVPAPAPIPTAITSHVDADQAGFQRILQMLGKKGESSTEATKSKTPQYSTGPQSSHQRNASPDLVALFKQDHPTRQTPTSQTSAPPGLERLVDSRSPAESHGRQTSTPMKDDLLLSLLSQAGLSAKTTQQQNSEQRPPPGFFGVPEQNRNGSRPQMPESERPMQQRDTARSIFDDPAISSMSYQEDMRSRDGIQRRPTNGSGFENAYLDSLRNNGRPEKPVVAPQNLPPGLNRPPGLNEMPRMPPGWEQQQRIQPQGRPGPPPGLARGMLPGYGPSQQPPMPPMPQQMMGQGQATQRTPQRKYTGETGIPGFPPNMGPPPGFMAGGPPPGFHHASEAGAIQNYGRYAMGGGQPTQQPQQQPPPPPNVNRAFMEMYGNGERGGLRGGNGGVPLPPGLPGFR